MVLEPLDRGFTGKAVLGLRSEGKIGDEVMRRIERDLEDSRLEI